MAMDQRLTPLAIKKMNSGREYRNITELRALCEENGDEFYRVSGYATTFNQPYVLGKYKRWYDGYEVTVEEQVDPNAFADCDMSDVIFQYNHEGRVYARTRNNTLSLECDGRGLLINADLGGTEEGRKLHEEIKGGYTDRMSFGFTVAEDRQDKTEDSETETVHILRTITKIGKLYDVSAVSIPANDMTSISARSYIDGLIDANEKERFERERRLLALRIHMELNKGV